MSPAPSSYEAPQRALCIASGLRRVKLQHVAARYSTSQHVTVRYSTLQYVTVRFSTAHYGTSQDVCFHALCGCRLIALTPTSHYLTLHCIAAHCNASHCLLFVCCPCLLCPVHVFAFARASLKFLNSSHVPIDAYTTTRTSRSA